jgi:hypothetical protein
VDECAETPSVCNHICNNTEGSYFCSCQIGYSLVEADKKSCQDIDECTHQEKFKFVKHLCEDKCQNTLGSYQCSCSKGYSLDANNRNCSDIDECKQDDVCEATAECNNTLGNYTCICKSGYSKDIEKNCIDEDECKDPKVAARCGEGIRQRVAMDFLKVHPGPQCPSTPGGGTTPEMAISEAARP